MSAAPTLKELLAINARERAALAAATASFVAAWDGPGKQPATHEPAKAAAQTAAKETAPCR